MVMVMVSLKPKQFDSSATPSGLQTKPWGLVKGALGTQRLPPEHWIIQTLLEKELLRLNLIQKMLPVSSQGGARLGFQNIRARGGPCSSNND